MFRTLNEMIDLLDEFGRIPDYWIKIKKYCKFKAVDIFRKLKRGEIPKTGGPKEKLSQTDYDNKVFYQWAIDEKIDLNKINKSYYYEKNLEKQEQKISNVDRKSDEVAPNKKEKVENIKYDKEDDDDFRILCTEENDEKFQENKNLKNIKNSDSNNGEKKEPIRYKNFYSNNNNHNSNTNLKRIADMKSILNIDESVKPDEGKKINIEKVEVINKRGNSAVKRAQNVRNPNCEISNNFNFNYCKNALNSNKNNNVINDNAKKNNIDKIKIVNPNYMDLKDLQKHSFEKFDSNKKDDHPSKIGDSNKKFKKIAAFRTENKEIKHNDLNKVEEHAFDNQKLRYPLQSNREIKVDSSNLNTKISQIFNVSNCKSILLDDGKNNNVGGNREKNPSNKLESKRELINLEKKKDQLKNEEQENSLLAPEAFKKELNENENDNNKNKKDLPKQRLYEDINAHSYDVLNQEQKIYSNYNFETKNLNHVCRQMSNLNAITPGYKERDRLENLHQRTSSLGNRVMNPAANRHSNNHYIENQNITNVNLNLYNNYYQVINPQQYAVTSNIPCVLGGNYEFNYDKYLASKSKAKDKGMQNYKKAENKNRNEEEDLIIKMLNNFKSDQKDSNQKNGNAKISNKDLIRIDNKKPLIDEGLNKKDNNSLDKPENLNNNNKKYEDINDILNRVEIKVSQNPDIIENKSLDKKQDEMANFSLLKTDMLTGFDLKKYKNLPDFKIPLEYNLLQNRAKFRTYFLNQAKSALADIKKDDVNSTIEKLELLLYYFTNMKGN